MQSVPQTLSIKPEGEFLVCVWYTSVSIFLVTEVEQKHKSQSALVRTLPGPLTHFDAES